MNSRGRTVRVSVEDGDLSISGECKFEKEEKGEEISPHRTLLRQLHANLYPSGGDRYDQGKRRVQRRRPHRAPSQERKGDPQDSGRQSSITVLVKAKQPGQR